MKNNHPPTIQELADQFDALHNEQNLYSLGWSSQSYRVLTQQESIIKQKLKALIDASIKNNSPLLQPLLALKNEAFTLLFIAIYREHYSLTSVKIADKISQATKTPEDHLRDLLELNDTQLLTKYKKERISESTNGTPTLWRKATLLGSLFNAQVLLSAASLRLKILKKNCLPEGVGTDHREEINSFCNDFFRLS